jgi:hypothetical protein
MYLPIPAKDGTLAHGERIMNIKRLAALVTLGALLSTAAPALAVTQNGTVNVEWNYAITATLTMYTQTTASQTHTIPAANDIFTQANGGLGQCNGSVGASKDPGSNLNVNFGNVVADGTDYTNCLEINAIDAWVVTNDSLGANLTVQATAGAPSDYDTATNGSLLCLLPDGTWSTTANTPWTASVRSAAVSMTSTTACSSGTLISAASATNILALTKSTTGSDYNADLQLNMGPAMQSGAQNVTLTYQLITN